MRPPLADKSPQALLLQSANETVSVGLLFALLGILPMLVAIWNSSAWQMQVMAAVNSLVLVGPGVWYFLAGRWLRRSQLWVLPITLKIGMGQIALVILMIPLACAGSTRRGGMGTLLMPVTLAVFFVPALSALLWELTRLRRVAHLLSVTGRAFEPVKVEPLDNAHHVKQEHREADH